MTANAVLLPVNNSTVNTNALDLGQISAFPVSEIIQATIVTTVAGNAANNRNVTFMLQHSDTNVSANFTNVAGAGPFYIPEVAAGYAATTLDIAIQPGTKRFIRAQIKTENLGGNPNSGTATFRLQF